MIRRIVYIALLLQMLLTSIVFAQTTQVTNGLNYLVSTQSVDGSWISGEESAIATSEAIETLKLLKQTGTANYINALSWLAKPIIGIDKPHCRKNLQPCHWWHGQRCPCFIHG